MKCKISHQWRLVSVLCLAICLMSACTGGGMGGRNNAKLESNPPLSMVSLPAGSRVWVEVQDRTALGDVGPELRSFLMALLQSDAGLSLADTASSATSIVRIDILQMDLTNSESVNFDVGRGFGVGLTGAALGLGIGRAVGGTKGSLWGLGLGLALGFTAGGAGGSDGTNDTWAMLTDVQITTDLPAKGAATAGKGGTQGKGAEIASRVAVTAEGRDMQRDAALATLQDALIQHIVRHMKTK